MISTNKYTLCRPLSRAFLFSAKSPYFQKCRLKTLKEGLQAGPAIIEIEIDDCAIEIGKLPETDCDHDFDYDSERPKCENKTVQSPKVGRRRMFRGVCPDFLSSYDQVFRGQLVVQGAEFEGGPAIPIMRS